MFEWQQDRHWLSRFEDILSTVNAVTFDVFDTALTRVLDTPADVFAIVEADLVRAHGPLFRGYAALREQAEFDARRQAAARGQREIGFDPILDALEEKNIQFAQYRDELLSEEVRVEHECCIPVPEIKAAVELCRFRGLPVLFVSDMYLSTAVVRSLLENAGYESPDLIVSCDTGCAKWDGSQWDIVLDRFGEAGRILHIGDNEGSDGRTADDAGLKTLLFKRARSNHRPGGPLSPDVLPFSRLLRAAMLRLAPGGADYDPTALPASEVMSMLGASWGATVVGTYVRWVARRAQELGVTHVYFCARDGWLPQQAWYAAKLDEATGITSTYLYISRRSLNFAAASIGCTPDYLTESTLDTLCAVFRKERLRDVLSRADLLNVGPLVEDILRHFGSLDRVISFDDGAAELKDCMRRHPGAIYPVLHAKVTTVVSYLTQEGVHEGRVAIVDVGWHGNMQVSIKGILEEAGYSPSIYGLYAGLWPAAQRNRGRSGWMESAFRNDYQSIEGGYGLHNSVAIIENTFAAAHGTTLGYRQDGSGIVPVLAEAGAVCAQNRSLLEPFQNETVAVIAQLFGQESHAGVTVDALTEKAATAAIDRLGLSPTMNEIAAIGSIQHSGDPSHARLTPLVQELVADLSKQERVDIDHSDWVIGSALVSLRRATTPDRRAALAHDLRHRLGHYDDRTIGQFK
ncbi:hypothetical protein C0V97_01595 [Asaia sp. W19]|uniref:HAD family hydrolase n=1 Tax=unclassified Asaia TaxID=2685023 RepID=UPI000F8C8F1D|nr:HAD family hydrolase [Asaia sp. W19]RUT27348.1 hypothetical protein C0V97_01595 [Asaia sp. W19]